MAIFHLETQVITRSEGRSSVACAAYRSGELLLDERTGTPHRYGDADRVLHTEILAPAGAPAWSLDRQQLWNRVEAGEKRKDSQLAREWEAALPTGLNLDQQIALLRGWATAELIPNGIVVDIAIHDGISPGKPANPHAHIMGTMRPVEADGWGAKYERKLHRDDLLKRWRSSWAEHTNRALELAGVKEVVSHLSHADRGLEELPTIKEGWAARQMEARGVTSDRVEKNRQIRAFNQRLRDRLRGSFNNVKEGVMRALGKGPTMPVGDRQHAAPLAPQAAKTSNPVPQPQSAAAGPSSVPSSTPKKPPPPPIAHPAPSPAADDVAVQRAFLDRQGRGGR